MPEKKILLLLEYTRTGGTRTYAKQLIEFYCKNGFELKVLVLGPEDDSEMTEYCNQRGLFLGHIEGILPQAVQYKSFPFRLFVNRNTIKNLVNSTQPDLMVASVGTPGLFITYLSIVSRSIYILHSLIEFDPRVAWWKRNAYKWIIHFLIPKGCRLLTVSNYSANRMSESWGLTDDKQPAVIYNCSGELVSHTQEMSASMNILTVGHVIDYKNPFYWIEIARNVLNQNPNVTFTWVGDGPLLDVCRQRVDSFGLSERLHFIGMRQNVSEFYANCDIYIHPSRVESFGIAVLDAMRYGKPSIVSREGGLPEIIQDQVSGYVIDLELGPESFAEHILKLANNHELRSKLGRTAQQVYSERFSPQGWEKQMLALHEEMLIEKA